MMDVGGLVANRRKIYEIKKVLGRDPLPLALLKMLLISLQFLASIIVYKSKKSSKKKKIIIFTNLYYTGNPRTVFERILEDPSLREKYEVYWMAQQLSTFFDLRKNSIPVLYKNGLLGIKKYINADLWVLAHRGAWNVPFFMQNKFNKIPKIQLWHGVGPKGITFKTEDYKNYLAFCVPSEFIKKRHVELWNAPVDRIHVTGEPKIDYLLKLARIPPNELILKLNISRLKIKNTSKFILYAPTFDGDLWPWGNPNEGFGELSGFLEKWDAYLLVRLHPYDNSYKTLKKIVKKYKNIIDVSMWKFPDTMYLLAASHILITDWSSIYTDFSVLNRPIIFLNVNPESFTEKRGKSLVPPEMRPGIIVNNKEDLLNALSLALTDKWPQEKIKEVRDFVDIIHYKLDGKSSERVISLIKKFMK